MKQTTRLAAIAGRRARIASQYAAAQSSVTLWGVADASIRYLTNANAKNDGLLSMTNARSRTAASASTARKTSAAA